MKVLIQSEFKTINLDDMLSQLGEDETKKILSSFVCPQNKDVEKFLKEKAILFSQHGHAKTFLVFWLASESEFGGRKRELVGYYALARKAICIPRETHLGRTTATKWRELCRKVNARSNASECDLVAHLIGQLGKNFNNGNNLLISGNELLGLAMKKVQEIKKLSGGNIVYVECEDKENLLKFYKENKFEEFGKRSLDRDETDIDGSSLMQLYRYV